MTRNHDTNRTRDNDDDALINQTDLTWKLATGAVKHIVLAGLELARETLNRRNYALDADPGAAGIQAPTSSRRCSTRIRTPQLTYTKTPNLRALSKGDTVALYVQDQMEFTPEWKALLGMRWERFDADAAPTRYRPGAATVGRSSAPTTC